MFHKMSEEKGYANLAMIMVLSMLIYIHSADAKIYTVGGSTGWIFNVSGWETGKPFKAGDKLVFKYAVGRHNVVVVDKGSYDSCSVPAGAPTYGSGNDKLTLKEGTNYFICGFTGHCHAGMKIAANAASLAS
ncbi:basic blue protein-like [Sesamum indicum]|uniref:Basic blue protein n=1 Tax=Sesamum indicum TaxID=4182 RepID=A0A6I9TNW7_SESIN|nr:basic blue protein-like [Sesamum indicum]